jgi:hypothetical protein
VFLEIFNPVNKFVPQFNVLNSGFFERSSIVSWFEKQRRDSRLGLLETSILVRLFPKQIRDTRSVKFEMSGFSLVSP